MAYRTSGLASGLLLLILALALSAGCLGQNAPEGAGSPAATPGAGSDVAMGDAGGGHDAPRMIDGLPVQDNSATTMRPPFDLGNPDLFVAFCDYVLVGRVERRVGTRYPGSEGSSSFPLTDYDVTVLEVIKGNLEVGRKILITKDGGISKDRSHVKLFDENDFMPEAGGIYVFVVGVEQDGKTLVAAGSYATVPLESGVAAELKRIKRPIGADKQEAVGKILEGSEVFARYVAAAENKNAGIGVPEIQNRKRYKSVYEK